MNLTETLSSLVAEHGYDAVKAALENLAPPQSTTNGGPGSGDPNQPPTGPGGNPPKP